MAVDSGGKSFHGWFDCTKANEADVKKFFTYAVRLGADPAMHKILQFARMPNGIRSNNRAKQRVLYWDPAAKGREWKLDALPGSIEVCSILEIPANEEDEKSNLLGDRFLCRGKAMQFVGPTGVGKSTLIVQAALLWGAGRDLFGIKAQQPHRIMYVQAENDDQDVATMVAGIVQGVGLRPEERQLAGQNVSYCRLNDYGKDILEQLDGVVTRLGVDILILDPLFAYLPGAIAEQAQVSKFLRQNLQPFLEQHNCGAIIIHHTPKPPTSKKDRPDWSGGDFAYAGFGSAELANFFKAALVIRSTPNRDLFELIVAKRHKRAGLRDMEGALTDKIHIQHSPDTTLQYWEQASLEEVEAAEAGRLASWGDAFVEVAGMSSGVISKGELANAIGVSVKTVERAFQGKDDILVSTSDGKRLLLNLKRGKIYGCEKTDEGVKISLRRPLSRVERDNATDSDN
jgi:hypothetical protein